MGTIEKTGINTALSGLSMPKEAAQRTSAKKAGAGGTESAGKQDSVELSENWEEKAELKKAVQKYLEEMKRQYSGISISVGTADPKGLKDTAKKLGNGTHLLISQDFLERMGSSREAFNECRDVLEETLEQLSSGKNYYMASGAYLEKDQLSYWSVPKKEDDLYSELEKEKKFWEDFMKQNNRDNTSKQKNFKYSASPGDFDTAGKYARLAGAGSRSAVQTVMGEAQRSIGSLRLVSCFGDDKERMSARSAIRSLQKLLLRGRRKISRLNEENLLQQRKKRAREQDMEERERKIKAELKRKRQARNTADGAIRMEGKLDAYWLDWRRKCLRDLEEEKSQYEAMVSADMSVGAPPVSGSCGGETFAAAEVTVSAPISF